MERVTTPARLRISRTVKEAIAAHRPVVALESTVITHGLPRPRNLEAGLRLEEVITTAGALPATIGVIKGDVVVGMNRDELSYLASSEVDKASTWNLAAICARGGDAGTTVATTLYAAAAAGIEVFATGGVGGVHNAPFDESADLDALARYPVLTVCAGPKSILDASATLERLESRGVSVVGYGTDRLPGFLVPLTSLPLPSKVSTPAEAAAVLRTQADLGLEAGVLLCKPVSDGLSPDEFGRLLDLAEAEMKAQGVVGRASTPFLLSALARLSEGATVTVNTRLLEENAGLAAEVAVALAGVPELQA